jgi:hypothetical protein
MPLGVEAVITSVVIVRILVCAELPRPERIGQRVVIGAVIDGEE